MSTLVDKITKNEKTFFQTSGSGGYKLTPKTLSGGGTSVDVVDCVRADGNTSYYYDTEVEKSLVVLHYTAGQLTGDIPTLTKKDYKVSVSYVLARDGTLYRLFDDARWSYHLGGSDADPCIGGNEFNSKRSVAIEISNFGWLKESGNGLITYSGTSYCTKEDTHLFHTLTGPWRGQRYFATFTEAQYASLKKLLKYLTGKHNIPYKFLSAEGAQDKAARHVLFTSKEEARAFKGIASHINFRQGKWDIGPAFDWHRLEEDGGSELHLPVNLGLGTRGTKQVVESYYTHTEATIRSGYFPMGTNTVWHGGVHVHKDPRTAVHAVAPGRVIAARLPQATDKAVGAYGSTSFVITRHTIEREKAKKHFFALYMHLHHEELTQKNTQLHAVPWLKAAAPATSNRYKVKIADLNFRSSPSSASKTNLIGPLTKGEVLVVTDKTTSDPWWKATRASGGAGWVRYSPDWLEPEAATVDPAAPLDAGLLSKLLAGDVVMVDRPVKAGDLLWTMGQYGSRGYRANMIHWEIFSEENLFADTKRYPDWTAVEDTNEDYNIDNRAIVGMVDQESGFFESDEILTSEELQKFYASRNKNVKQVRRIACRFVSEWGIDLDKAIPKMKGRWSTFGLKDDLSPYVFWKDAAAAKVPLPAKPLVWHYNPVAFVESLVDAVLPEQEAAPPPPRPEPSSIATTSTGRVTCTCGSTDDDLFVDPVTTPSGERDLYLAVKSFWISSFGASDPAYLHEDVAMVFVGHIAGEVGWEAKSMKNYNVGNHKRAKGKMFTAFRTWEEYTTEAKAKAACNCASHTEYVGRVEKKNGKIMYAVRFFPPHKQSHFGAFKTLNDGMAAHIGLLQRRYSGCTDALSKHAKGTAASAKFTARVDRIQSLATAYAGSLEGYATAGSYDAFIIACAQTARKKFEKNP
ncbi:N-acetylmuramoyl-L-alanine amidase [Chondromyces apiculatus]|uniref:N-acetylmuramoyl-L-alanine amidase n=1 Tax=Chondromyces apiculatus DSM 436 TaxID=1192034 RepID=A0A017TEG0_9BACT|nr:N-acetylmuramoyl-L-alanine amidase [Chondromyces apiculatus]EYF07210.1 Hypothetical protein CAP_0689 [Chondromyces apiculatus DSM 436]